MKISQSKEWADFHVSKVEANYLNWPNEPMLKTVFGSNSANPVFQQPSWRVLDVVGFGFGNNLVPFADMGCESLGVEIDPKITSIEESIIAARAHKATVVVEQNSALHYSDAHFDLVLSVASIHYESIEKNVLLALREFKRVTKPGGRVYIATADRATKSNSARKNSAITDTGFVTTTSEMGKNSSFKTSVILSITVRKYLKMLKLAELPKISSALQSIIRLHCVAN
jgi:SAM-dependent methyltransferase